MSCDRFVFQEEVRRFDIVGAALRFTQPLEAGNSDFVGALRDRLTGLPHLSRLQVEFGTRTKTSNAPFTACDEESFVVVRGEITTPNVRTPFLWQAARAGAIRAMEHFDDITICIHREVEAALHGVALTSPQEQDVVMDPWLTSQFIHETIGHTLEHDNFVGYGMRAGWHIGMALGCESLNVGDDPTLPGIRGGYSADDEGYPGERVPLVAAGRIVGTLTSCAWGARSNGHGRVSRPGRTPLPRAAISTIEGGHSSREELIAGVERGIFCAGVWGGGSQGDTFVVRPVYGRVIHEGKLTEQYLRRFDLAGSKRRYLSSIDAVANDVRTFQPRYGCIKDEGGMIPVGFRAPTLRMRAVPIIAMKNSK